MVNTKGKYSWVTDKMFNDKLQEFIKRDVSQIMFIPNVYTSLADYYNNEVLELLEEEREDERG